MFQSAFKYYKSKNSPPSFKDVLIIGDNGCPFKPTKGNAITQTYVFPSLIAPEEWKIYEVVTRSGLFVIANPFTPAGQRYWMERSLLDYPAEPNITNLSSERGKDNWKRTDWWQHLRACNGPFERRKFAKTLRWSTLGYQYDWTNKLYDETRKEIFPSDLASLVRYVAAVLGFEQFSPEAAIVNYYPIGTTLAGHTDHSEDNRTAPLFSISFGQPAIFLIGGHSRDDPADAILLRSGDILAMTGPSRQYYHAVPRVFSDIELPEALGKCSERWHSRVPHCEDTEQLDAILPNSNRPKTALAFIDEYMQYSRININVRQVLQADQTTLSYPEHESSKS